MTIALQTIYEYRSIRLTIAFIGVELRVSTAVKKRYLICIIYATSITIQNAFVVI